MPNKCATISAMKIKNIKKLKCLRCGYEWLPRKTDVRQCPNRKCHSIYWDMPRLAKDEIPCVKDPTEF